MSNRGESSELVFENISGDQTGVDPMYITGPASCCYGFFVILSWQRIHQIYTIMSKALKWFIISVFPVWNFLPLCNSCRTLCSCIAKVKYTKFIQPSPSPGVQKCPFCLSGLALVSPHQELEHEVTVPASFTTVGFRLFQ